jgi:hypothetical protein
VRTQGGLFDHGANTLAATLKVVSSELVEVVSLGGSAIAHHLLRIRIPRGEMVGAQGHHRSRAMRPR